MVTIGPWLQAADSLAEKMEVFIAGGATAGILLPVTAMENEVFRCIQKEQDQAMRNKLPAMTPDLFAACLGAQNAYPNGLVGELLGQQFNALPETHQD